MSFVPVVRTQRASDSRFFVFCSSDPVQKWSAPSSQIVGSGVTCGRPSRRTVDSQNISDSASTETTSDQGRAVASGALKSSDNSAIGSWSDIDAPLGFPTQGFVRNGDGTGRRNLTAAGFERRRGLAVAADRDEVHTVEATVLADRVDEIARERDTGRGIVFELREDRVGHATSGMSLPSLRAIAALGSTITPA